jgi:predicted transcriptional regulator
MSSSPKSLNDVAWEHLFFKYDILNQIDANGRFEISAKQMKEYREPRLMAKFDHAINLPKIFFDNRLAILPVTRGSYVISHFNAYHEFENTHAPVKRFSLPAYIQSLNSNNISSESIALNCAVAAGIIADFLQDEDLISTVCGRMSSGSFDFAITNTRNNTPCRVQVNNSQIEIDAAYEGVRGLALFEAKHDLSNDFLVRQLYYPFRTWQSRITKPVRSLFLVYSNSIYRLYEYSFQDVDNYCSLALVNQKNYSIEDTDIEITDIQAVLKRTAIIQEPQVPFPQADRFERVINICELLNERELSRSNITEHYAFDVRQTNYYTDAARYLGLLEKRNDDRTPVYRLSEKGRQILGLNYKQRQLAYCDLILSHKVFSDVLRKCFEKGNIPVTGDIIQIMKASNLYHVESDSTFERRSSTVKGWLNWILGLVNE